jgi:hypothetical protein
MMEIALGAIVAVCLIIAFALGFALRVVTDHLVALDRQRHARGLDL